MWIKLNGKEKNWLVIMGVPFQGALYNESLGVEVSRQTMRDAKAKIKTIQEQITRGTFNLAAYTTHFPKSRVAVEAVEQAATEAAAIAQASITLREYLPQWLESRKVSAELKPETGDDYYSLIKSHLLTDEIADKPMRAITEDDLIAFVKRMTEKVVRGKKLSPRRINMVIARLRTAFHDAQRKRLADGSRMITENPMEFIVNRQQEQTQVDPFDADEAAAIIDLAQGWFRNYLTLAIHTGMRPGEILGLKWDDIDFRKRLILVRHTLAKSGRRAPKTRGSVRDLPMVELVYDALAKQHEKTSANASGLVFCTEDDTPMSLDNIRDRSWRELIKNAGIGGEKVRYRPLYQCRHSYAAIRLTAGDDIRQVAQALGHTTTAMVTATYGRWYRKTNAVPETAGRENAA